MKLTWFGGTTLRVHIGGEIVVVDGQGAPEGIDATELHAGADHSISLDGVGLAQVDALGWTPPRQGSVLDDRPAPLSLLRLGDRAILLHGQGEPPLVLAAGAVPEAGRWAHDAIIVAFDADTAGAALQRWNPRLLALAVPPESAEAALTQLRDRLGGTGLMLFEAGFALEV
jgi:hypothetical protein